MTSLPIMLWHFRSCYFRSRDLFSDILNKNPGPFFCGMRGDGQHLGFVTSGVTK